MQAGSFFPNRPQPTLYAMAADDLPLHFDMANLTKKQQADHYDQNRLLAMLQIALLCIGKPDDYVAVFDAFTRPPWREWLARHHELIRRLGLPVIPLEHLIYAPMDRFYETVAEQIPAVELITFLMMSRSNQAIHGDQASIERMLDLNSKFHFAQHAPRHGIPVPDTLIASQPLRNDPNVAAFFSRHNDQVMLKMTGQPGARNVKAVQGLAQAEAFLEDYRFEEPVLLQQRLPLDHYVEWTADLLLTNEEVSLDNVRRILVADGLWIGNLIPAENPMTDAQLSTLLNVGRYAQQFGFGTSVGDNLGIDYFIGPDGEVLVTEINPRWTAGLFPSEALRRLNGRSSDAIAYFELIRLEQYDAFLDFVAEHPPTADKAGFGLIHLGFSPYAFETEGASSVYCWLVVLGSFPAYREAAGNLLGPDRLPNGARIPI